MGNGGFPVGSRADLCKASSPLGQEEGRRRGWLPSIRFLQQRACLRVGAGLGPAGALGAVLASQARLCGLRPPDGSGPRAPGSHGVSLALRCGVSSGHKPSPLAGMGAGRRARPGKEAAHLRTPLHWSPGPWPRQARPCGGGRIGGWRARGRVGRASAASLSHRDPAVGLASPCVTS